MQVINNEQRYTVRWQYGNPALDRIAELEGVSKEERKTMTHAQLCEKLGYTEKKGDQSKGKLPLPELTTCFIEIEGGGGCSATVRRYYKDPHSLEKARKYALAKCLKIAFPNVENKDIRKAFWKAYLSRKDQKPAVVKNMLETVPAS